MSDTLVFLKLGGSLITDKGKPHTPRLDVLERLAREIAEAHRQDPRLHLLLGHGSGSYGHVAARQHQTREGVSSEEDWQGFVKVWRQAAELDQLVLAALAKAELPALVFSPSAMIISRGGRVETWNLEPVRSALSHGLLPVIYGDVVFDQELGGTILSTEELFGYLAPRLKPLRLLFAGYEPGVWADYPANTTLLSEITPSSFAHIQAGLKGSAAPDVTGGMLDKVQQILSMSDKLPGLQTSIFSGETPGNVRQALLGEMLGTQVHS
jgi:isopentenyl phosphate kinase